ncbi:MAG: hypothetical protein ACOCTS_01070 [Thermodesulfobacteriota bacterium]
MRGKGLFCSLFLAMLLLLAACQPRISTEPIQGDRPAERLLAGLYTRNQSLQTFKGIGRIRMRQGAHGQTARIAWMAAMDGRTRIEILGPSGRPLIKLAYDGETFYYRRAADEGVQQRNISNPSLDRVIDVPLTLQELVYFLAGRFPLYENHEVRFGRRGSGPSEPLIVTHGLSGWREVLRLSGSHENLESVSLYKGDALRYQVKLSDYRQADGFKIPSRLVFSSAQAAGFEIRVERFWPNTGVSATQFVIGPGQ